MSAAVCDAVRYCGIAHMDIEIVFMLQIVRSELSETV